MKTAMTSERIKEIQETTAYPESLSVKQALLQVWNECEQSYASHPSPVMSAEQVCRWVKASERMPNVAGVNVVVRFKRNGYEYCTFGRKNFDKEAAMYFEYGYESFITTDCEWLDESPTSPAKPMSAEQVEEDAINSRFDNDKFIENVCLSYNHGFGLMAEQDKQALRLECKEWMRAIKNNWKYHVSSPSVNSMSAEQVEEDAINSRFGNEKFVENVCLSYNHSFGLMAEQDKQALRFECNEWMIAIKNNWKYHAASPTVKADGWVRVEDRLPEIIEGKDYSENVFAWCNGQIMIMCRTWVDGEPESGYVWANCYDDIDGEGIWDENYYPTHWQPLQLPSPPITE